MPQRLRYIEHEGCRILLEDFSGILDEQEYISLIREAQTMVHLEPPGSARILIDVTESRFTPAVSHVSREVSDSNTPYVKATALVGVRGLMPIIIRALSASAGRELVSFPTREEALAWLASDAII